MEMPQPENLPELPAQANKPTEQEKLDRKTKHRTVGKLLVGSEEKEIIITTTTTPNAGGGYDTIVALPSANPLTAVPEQPGG